MGKKLKIAVTGGIGSGKSTVSSIFEDREYTVFKADDIAKKILVNDKDVRNKIVKAFGEGAYNNKGVNTKYLAEKVFSKKENVKKINSIVHPATIEKIKRLMKEELKSAQIVFVEAALIFEAGMENLFDYILYVSADENTRIKRVTERDGVSEEDVKARMDNQLPEAHKKGHSDFVVENNGSKEQLIQKTHFFLSIFEKIVQS